MHRPRRVVDLLNPASMLMPASNVIMQLSAPGVGYGVLESPVDSGNVYKHPFKRARTTGTYLAAATIGTDADRKLIRSAIGTAHAQVRSTASSPVSYHAFDPKLQLWVAACLYKGAVDIYRIFVGEMDEETAEQHYRDGMALGTTLQVPEEMWPADRQAFDRYWQESLEEVRIDDAVREYLYPIAVSRVRGVRLPGPIQRPIERLNLLITTGFLPQKFRDEMHFEWNAEKQRRFDRLMRVIRFVNNLAPRFVRAFPFNVLLHDLDWRIRTGRPLV